MSNEHNVLWEMIFVFVIYILYDRKNENHWSLLVTYYPITWNTNILDIDPSPNTVVPSARKNSRIVEALVLLLLKISRNLL